MSGAQRLTLEARLHAVAGDIAIPDRAVAEFDGGGSGYPVSTGRVDRRGRVSWPIRTPTHPMAVGGHHGRPVGRGRAVWRDPWTVNAPAVCGVA